MKTIDEPARSVPVMAETDVLVVGSGPAGLSADSLHTWMEEGKRVVFLDVQPESLYTRARLPLAVPAHGASISDLRDVIPVDPTVPIVIYNTDGERPPWEKDLGVEMVRYGFQTLYWLEGGVEGWMKSGYDVDGSRVFPRQN